MKIFLLCVVFICFVLIGFGVGNFYKKRRDFYVDLCNFCDYSSSQVSFFLKKTSDIVATFKKNCGEDFCKYLTSFEELLNCDLDESAFNDVEISFLSREEMAEVGGLFLSFGQMDREEELEKLATCKKKFATKKAVCLENYQKYRSLYVKLFFLLGLIFVVVFL